MKHIGIVTLNGYENYGNRLQNYALQEAIKSLGLTAETVIIKSTDNKSLKNKFSIILKSNPKTLLYKISNKGKNYLLKRKNRNIILERKKRFKDFSVERIAEKELDIGNQEMINKYNYFVVGSDQVWNPHYIKNSLDNFLAFASPNKRVSYAPSFGTSSIPAEYLDSYKIGLNGFTNLSVREDVGAQIIHALTGKEADVVLDPTMLLTSEKWLSIATPPLNKPKSPFLLTYFLGDVSDESQKTIKKIAMDENLVIVNLANINDKEWYTVNPAEFIDLIHSSHLFCTDSFHGVVFSILLETPFMVFNRSNKGYSMNSRIENQLRKFSLEDRLSKNIKNSEDVLKKNYTHVHAILERERSTSLSFLKNSVMD